MGQRSKEQHLAAALALLDERGPATTAFELFEMTALAEAVGLHRSTMYRYWNTSSDLHDDLARWLVVEHQGWQRQILAQDPAQPARASLASALDGITAEFAIAIRGAACGFRFDVAGPEIAAWERAWLDALGRWVAAHLQAHDRRPAAGTGAFDIGLALASVVEGALLIGALHGGALLEGWRPEQTDRIVDVADRLLTGMSREGSDPRARPWAGAPELPRVAGWSAAKQAVFTRIDDLLNREHLGGAITPEPQRLIDFRTLSAQAGISTRRLFAIWPTAEAFNGDLVGEVYRRHAALTEAAASAALAEALEEPNIDAAGVTLALSAAVVSEGASADRSSVFACMPAMAVPEVRRRGEGELDGMVRTLRISSLALLQSFGYDLRPGHDIQSFTEVAFEVMCGAQRLAIVNRDLLECTVLDRRRRPVGSLASGVAHTILTGAVAR
jgi:AcrR family transcriptional regulator